MRNKTRGMNEYKFTANAKFLIARFSGKMAHFFFIAVKFATFFRCFRFFSEIQETT